MKTIPLTRGKFAIVDDEDYDQIRQWSWYAQRMYSSGDFYAIRTVRVQGGKKIAVAMHRQVLSAPPGFVVDHINHDTLDNRRENLRVCSVGQNVVYQKLSVRNASGFKGVSWSTSTKKWVANVTAKGARLYLGVHSTPEAAARAYDAKAIELFGEFALTNKMLGLLK